MTSGLSGYTRTTCSHISDSNSRTVASNLKKKKTGGRLHADDQRTLSGVSGYTRMTSGVSGHMRMTSGVSGHMRMTSGVSGHMRMTSGVSGYMRMTSEFEVSGFARPHGRHVRA